MKLEQKLKISFDPTKIDPVVITSENSKIIISQLKLFDEKLYSMKESIDDTMNHSIRYSMKESMWASINNSKQASIWNSIWDSVKDSMWFSMRDSINDQMKYAMKFPVWDSLRDSMRDSVWDSMKASIFASMSDSMWASICVNLLKDEYEFLFEDEEFLKKLPYNKVIELCDLFQWFSERGLFIHRSFKQNNYLLASWKNPKQIQILNILQEVK